MGSARLRMDLASTKAKDAEPRGLSVRTGGSATTSAELFKGGFCTRKGTVRRPWRSSWWLHWLGAAGLHMAIVLVL